MAENIFLTQTSKNLYEALKKQQEKKSCVYFEENILDRLDEVDFEKPSEDGRIINDRFIPQLNS
jgi:hypothetical protein